MDYRYGWTATTESLGVLDSLLFASISAGTFPGLHGHRPLKNVAEKAGYMYGDVVRGCNVDALKRPNCATRGRYVGPFTDVSKTQLEIKEGNKGVLSLPHSAVSRV